MIYQHLFNQTDPDKTVRAGVIGTGHFATAVVTQAQAMARLDVPIVADIDVEAAQQAYHRAGVADEDIALCENRAAALAALEGGRRAVVRDAQLLMDLPLDVIVESTGVPEAGAQHAREAIRHGKHVAMVSKEPDVVVGPMLAHLARQAGVLYTPVDGDQHGLLMSLVAWARELGLDVLCGGKARDAEFVYDLATSDIVCGAQRVTFSAENTRWLGPVPTSAVQHHVQARKELLAPLPQVGGFDLVEMAIAANATGLEPDRPYIHNATGAVDANAGRLHCPPLHIAEIPQVLAPMEEGGILEKRGVIDAVTCLRQPHEAGLGGGVFVVVACENDYSRHILTTKGLLPNARGSTALIYRPYHLCGVETPMSLLCAGLLGVATGAADVRPRVDVIMRATRTLRAGETLGTDHSPDLEALMAPAHSVTKDTPLPLHMGNSNRLRVDVPAGTIITAEMVDAPPDSALWALRRQQDQHFLDDERRMTNDE